MRSLATALCSLAIASIVGACTAVGGASASASAQLDGRTFLSSSIAGHDLEPGTTVRLSFRDGQLGIDAGCNHMGGPYSVVDGRIRVGSMMTTEMGCEPRLMAQDAWVGQFIGGSKVALDGAALTLANAGVTMHLTDRVVADPDRPLVGTRWVVDGIVTGDAVSSIPDGVVAAITFSDERVAVETGCNSGGGTVAIAATTFTVGPIVLTRKACPPGPWTVEQAMVAVLHGRVGYTIEAARLTLSNGASGLTLHAAG